MRYASKFPDSTGPTSREAGLSNRLCGPLCGLDDKNLCSPLEAVKLATRAVTLLPTNANHWNTLGLAHYLTGNWNAHGRGGRQVQTRRALTRSP